MKDMLIKLIWVVVIVAVLFPPGCKKVDPSLENSIYHKWEWIQSEGGIGGVVQDPGSEGYTQAIRFEEEGRYTRFRDGAVLHRGNFSLLGSKSLLDGKVYQMISFDDGSPSHAIISVLGDRLTLREECFDCFTHDYRR